MSRGGFTIPPFSSLPSLQGTRSNRRSAEQAAGERVCVVGQGGLLSKRHRKRGGESGAGAESGAVPFWLWNKYKTHDKLHKQFRFCKQRLLECATGCSCGSARERLACRPLGCQHEMVCRRRPSRCVYLLTWITWICCCSAGVEVMWSSADGRSGHSGSSKRSCPLCELGECGRRPSH